ncbi:hypothetical protein [Streptomyces pseudovenezuelae]|uniref:ABC-type sugar transport system permease subunit n=1 Tax=Streptomyces pseudovenezuelae TaxID=67350 RepID=A0ABT6LUZ6_9ACTN|nr:hypothetical protein [Streptomyces pseudovenezuelae]MDH6219649.1 ABC-type sugar transport system permease subunit [Streptomyces pseudovenezuelae]
MATSTSRQSRRAGHSRLPYLLVLPATLLLLLSVIAPGAYALLLSFQQRKVSGACWATAAERSSRVWTTTPP